MNVAHILKAKRGKIALRNHPLYRHSHQWIDEVDLEMCRAIADKVRRDPELMRIPSENLRRWKRKLHPWPRALREWEEILKDNSTKRVLEILTQDNDEGQRLRQSDPFVGILSERERLSFLKFDEKITA